MPLLINGQPFVPPEGLEIDESNPFTLIPISGGFSIEQTQTGIYYRVRVWIDYTDGNLDFLSYDYSYVLGKITRIDVETRPSNNPFTWQAPSAFFILIGADGNYYYAYTFLRPVSFTGWRYQIDRVDGTPSPPLGCTLTINYSNGSKSPSMNFPVCPTVTIEPDCNCVCPSTLNLADSVVNLLRSF